LTAKDAYEAARNIADTAMKEAQSKLETGSADVMETLEKAKTAMEEVNSRKEEYSEKAEKVLETAQDETQIRQVEQDIEVIKQVADAAQKVSEATQQLADTNKLAKEAEDAYQNAYTACEILNEIQASDEFDRDKLAEAVLQVQAAYESWVLAQQAADAARLSANEAYAAYQTALQSLHRFHVSETSSTNRRDTPVAAVSTTFLEPGEPFALPPNDSLSGMVQIDPEPVAVIDTRTTAEGNTPSKDKVKDSTVPETVEKKEPTQEKPKTDDAALIPEQDKSQDGAYSVVIKEENTPLASSVPYDEFTWWWVVILTVIAGSSYMGYRLFKKNKEDMEV